MHSHYPLPNSEGLQDVHTIKSRSIPTPLGNLRVSKVPLAYEILLSLKGEILQFDIQRGFRVVGRVEGVSNRSLSNSNRRISDVIRVCLVDATVYGNEVLKMIKVIVPWRSIILFRRPQGNGILGRCSSHYVYQKELGLKL